MLTRRRKSPEVRRGELVAAAGRVFAEKGVANSAVGDIVKAAGVAQGTFYLYFKTKTDIINAVVEQTVEDFVGAIERSMTATDSGAVAKLLALRDAVLEVANDSTRWDLARIYHRPENRAVHDRMAERLAPRLAPLVEGAVRQGVAEGVFSVEDPRAAAWFVLGGLHMLEVGFGDLADLPAAVTSATNYALRALGYNAWTQERATGNVPSRNRHAD